MKFSMIAFLAVFSSISGAWAQSSCQYTEGQGPSATVSYVSFNQDGTIDIASGGPESTGTIQHFTYFSPNPAATNSFIYVDQYRTNLYVSRINAYASTLQIFERRIFNGQDAPYFVGTVDCTQGQITSLKLPTISIGGGASHSQQPKPQASGLQSKYSTIDPQSCQNYQEGEGGSSSAICMGYGGAALEIMSGDWENMNIIYKGQKFATWFAISQVGPNILGGSNRLAEWLLTPSGEPQSLIIRSENPGSGESKLFVFGFTPQGVCYRGMATTNEYARDFAASGLCPKMLDPVWN